MKLLTRGVLAALATGGAIVANANADVVATATYDDLAGTFIGGGGAGTFTASAVNTANLRTSGDASRLVGPAVAMGTASFAPGFEGGADPATFNLQLTVTPINATMASGFGQFIAVDRDGDNIQGTITGTWYYAGPGFIFFNGALSNVTVNSVSDNFFDGTSGGAWRLDLPGGPIYSGAMVQLVFGGTNFFQTPFADRATGITAQLIPAPGALALAGIAGLLAGRRRR